MKILGIIISTLVGIGLLYISQKIQIDRLLKGLFIGIITTSILFAFYDVDQKK